MRRVRKGKPAFYTVTVETKKVINGLNGYSRIFNSEEKANAFAQTILERENTELLKEVSIVKTVTLVCFSNDPKKEDYE